LVLNNKLDIDIVIINNHNADHLAELAWYEILEDIEKEVPLLLDESSGKFWQGSEVISHLDSLSNEINLNKKFV